MMEGAFDTKTSVVEVYGTQRTREQHVPIIDGLVNNNEGQFQVNVRNDGALAGVANDVAVEVPAIVNAKGVQPLRVKPLPPKVMLPSQGLYQRELRPLSWRPTCEGNRTPLRCGYRRCRWRHSEGAVS